MWGWVFVIVGQEISLLFWGRIRQGSLCCFFGNPRESLSETCGERHTIRQVTKLPRQTPLRNDCRRRGTEACMRKLETIHPFLCCFCFRVFVNFFLFFEGIFMKIFSEKGEWRSRSESTLQHGLYSRGGGLLMRRKCVFLVFPRRCNALAWTGNGKNSWRFGRAWLKKDVSWGGGGSEWLQSMRQSPLLGWNTRARLICVMEDGWVSGDPVKNNSACPRFFGEFFSSLFSPPPLLRTGWCTDAVREKRGKKLRRYRRSHSNTEDRWRSYVNLHSDCFAGVARARTLAPRQPCQYLW